MNNIVDLGTGRSRPRRSAEGLQAGARILFFTGVRYVRAVHDEVQPFAASAERYCENLGVADVEGSGLALELAAR